MSDNLKEKLREDSTTDRQAAEHLQKNMESRAEAELMQPTPTMEEVAREAATTQRHHEAHLRETMQERVEEEIGG